MTYNGVSVSVIIEPERERAGLRGETGKQTGTGSQRERERQRDRDRFRIRVTERDREKYCNKTRMLTN